MAQSTGGKHKAVGRIPPSTSFYVAPCFSPVAVPTSRLTVKEQLHLYSPKIIFGPLRATSRLMWPLVKMSLTPWCEEIHVFKIELAMKRTCWNSMSECFWNCEFLENHALNSDRAANPVQQYACITGCVAHRDRARIPSSPAAPIPSFLLVTLLSLCPMTCKCHPPPGKHTQRCARSAELSFLAESRYRPAAGYL